MKQHVELQPQLLLHILFQLNLNNFFPTSYVVTNPPHSHKNKKQKMKQGTQKIKIEDIEIKKHK